MRRPAELHWAMSDAAEAPLNILSGGDRMTWAGRQALGGD